MEAIIPLPKPINFNAINLAEVWQKWRQSIELYLNAVMLPRSEEEKISCVLIAIGEDGRDIYNTWDWETISDEDGNTKRDITIAKIFERFKEICETRKRNVIIERMNFFKRKQGRREAFENFLSDLYELSHSCDFGALRHDMIVYKLADGLCCEKLCLEIISKGTSIDLEKVIEMCQSDCLHNCRNGRH